MSGNQGAESATVGLESVESVYLGDMLSAGGGVEGEVRIVG